jgi:hypothetical protein
MRQYNYVLNNILNVSFDIINCDLVKPGIFHISEVSEGVHQVIFVLMLETFLYNRYFGINNSHLHCLSREGDRQQQVLHGPSLTPAGLPHGDRNKMLMPPPHSGL